MPRRLTRPAARLVALAAACLPGALAAQNAVTGVVIDSLRRRPLPGAVVQLVPAPGVPRAAAAQPRTVDADTAGAFRIDDVPAGTYLLGFLHPRLDELGIQPVVRRLVLTGPGPALRADLGVPGPRALAAAVCGSGAAGTDSLGVFLGRVRAADAAGAPVPGAAVAVTWVELRVDAGGLRRERRAAQATADDEGRFAVCGVPADAPVLARAARSPALGGAVASARASSDSASTAAAASGDVELQIPPERLLERELLVTPTRSPAPRTARLSGRVRRPDGAPVLGARLQLDGTGPIATTDSAGAFALAGLPAGTRTLEARAIGFAPRRVAVDLVAGRAAAADVTLTAPVTTLGRVTVYGKAGGRDATGFLERSRRGFGRFIFGDEIDRSHTPSATSLLRMVPGLRVVPAPDGVHSRVYSRGALDLSRSCEPDVFIDGTIVRGAAAELDNLVHTREVAGIEVYTDFASAPGEFQRGPCGSIVVWTRGALPAAPNAQRPTRPR